MAENEKDTEKQTESPAPRRLLRSSKDRVFWGVAGGLGEYFRLDPTLVRLAFAVSAFFGGLGVLAYLVMAVVVPEDDGTGQPRPARRPPIWAIVLLGLAILIVLPGPFFGFHHGWGGDGWWGWWLGPLWIVFLVALVVVLVRVIRGRPPRFLQGSRREAAAADTSEAPTAEGKDAGEGTTAATEVRDGEPPRWVRGIAIVLLVLVAIAAACCVAACAAWATATGHGSVVAGVVIALGAAIAATAFIGEAKRIAPWLLAAALVLGLPAGATAAADVHFDGGIGEREYRPVAVTDIPSDGYDFGVGQLVVDLRDLPWATGQTISVSSELGVGQMIVSVPSNVCVVAHATGKAGELLVRGDQSDGIDPEIDQGEPRSNAPRLDLAAGIQLGQLVVTDRDPDDITDHGRDFDRDELSEESQREVCGL
ncbi:MAG TPA: PspC domain-containing protein [Solirubrobacterales bacterium]|nr:PspC domain-containing protein [Solirubrobacterales bacterium]